MTSPAYTIEAQLAALKAAADDVEGGVVIEFTTFRSIPDFHRAPVAFLEAAE